MKLALPYIGPRLEHSPNNITEEYGVDNKTQQQRFVNSYNPTEIPLEHRLDGEWKYRFNSLGFRGEELGTDADATILVAGCSYTFGTGVKWEQSWPFVFHNCYKDYHQLKDVNLLNISQGGAPNDYIGRTVIEQCAFRAPSLAIVFFTHTSRFEYLEGTEIQHFASCHENEISDAYFSYYTEQIGAANALRNILLVQEFCSARRIPLLIGWVERSLLSAEHIQNNQACFRLTNLIDKDMVFGFSINDSDTFVDFARDMSHPGPKSHELFAQNIFTYYCDVYSKR